MVFVVVFGIAARAKISRIIAALSVQREKSAPIPLANRRNPRTPTRYGSKLNFSRHLRRCSNVSPSDQIGRRYWKPASTLNRVRGFGKPLDIALDNEHGFRSEAIARARTSRPSSIKAIRTASVSTDLSLTTVLLIVSFTSKKLRAVFRPLVADLTTSTRPP